jgi:hypothetical protein
MHNETLFPALRRVYPTVTGTPFVEQARAKTADTAPAGSVAGRRGSFSSAGDALPLQADSTSTIFLASAVGRLGPVLGVILLLWGLIAWSAGWLGAIAS